GVGGPHPAVDLSTDWGDAMLILGLQRFLEMKTQEQDVRDFLDAFFGRIERYGMKKMNHPDRVPVVMGNILYNVEQRRSFDHALERFERYVASPKLNYEGLIDHMGHHFFKRLGARISFGFFGVPHSVWADSMMMYV